jgi:hypothetical protein
MTAFTLVRHSGYAVAGNPALESAVEVCEITDHQAYTVRAAGGTIYPTRDAAHAAEAAVNTAVGSRARGYFSSLRIAGAEIHVTDA